MILWRFFSAQAISHAIVILDTALRALIVDGTGYREHVSSIIETVGCEIERVSPPAV